MNEVPALILTPTARLARAEKLRLALACRDQGAWIPPAVLSFSGWINRLRDEALLAGDDQRVPVTAAQALVLWQEVIDRDIFIGEPRVAEMAAAAWRLLHEYELPMPAQWPPLLLNEDSRRFRDWAARFQALCDTRGLVDEWSFAAALPGLMNGPVTLPACIRLVGFELPVTPLQRSILAAAEQSGCRIERDDPAPAAAEFSRITSHAEPDDELRAAACWARSWMMQDADQRIAVVIPDLHARFERVERIFRQIFDPPGFALASGGDPPWHISLGPALAQWPLVADALEVLRLDPAGFDQAEAGAVLRSPFLAGAVTERRARARTQAALARRKPDRMHAGELVWQAGQCEAHGLQQHLTAWQAVRRAHRDRAAPSIWVARFQQELQALGFGHGRPLDSREYQVLQRFHGLLEEFATLDLVVAQPLSRRGALDRLTARAAAVAFRERNPGTAVEIVGVEEALGARFDALWLTTLDHQTWPPPARRDPLIPAVVQQAVAGATGDGSLARARLELDGLRRAAGTLYGSFATGSGEDMLTLTPLLSGHPIEPPEVEPLPVPAPMETVPDDTRAPALADTAVRGGTGVLQRQSDCPFRAFAEWRLGAADLTPPRPGLDARVRGSLVHRALERFWQGLDGGAALQALDQTALDARIDSACRHALDHLARHSPLALSEAGRELERTCLARTLRRWLALERARGEFSVRALETEVELRPGGLALTGKIDRLDEIEGGGTVVIDYKTGLSGKNGWVPEDRLADVQLPAYAVSMAPRPVAIAFARLRPDTMGFDGLAEVDIGTPGVEVIGQIRGRSKFRETESWPALVGDWQQSLDRLAAGFRAGEAEVSPREPRVCDYCHLHSLCRIYERQWVEADTGDK